MLLVSDIRLPLAAQKEDALLAARRALGLSAAEKCRLHIHKVSVDARRKDIKLVYTVAVQLPDAARESALAQKAHVRHVQPQPLQLQPGSQSLPGPVVICGLGPAGLFCALALAEAGYAPLVLERGPDMARRREAVAAFENGAPLQPNANIQFGEGGAGTFSDGKLTTRIGDALRDEVTSRLLAAGAPEEIAWQSRPHIGTDQLQGVFQALRMQMQQAGGRVLFNTQLTALHTAGSAPGASVTALQTSDGSLPCGVLVMACGHSARDTYRALAHAGALLLPKPFSVGVRAEHLQQTINEGLYHAAAGHPALPPGEYQLSARCGGRGVYTFCMCPGGSVVAAASEEEGVVTNGMSLHARNGKNANAAVVVGVDSADFGPDPFGAIAFQRQLEHAAYAAAGGTYAAPAETLGSFLNEQGRLQLGAVQPTYPRGVVPLALAQLLPAPVAQALKEGFAAFGRKLPGYDKPDTVLTGLETRTSAPVRLVRNDAFESEEIPGLYPCGEGAGYAGGIMSAAVDGLRVAHAIIRRYRPPAGA